jgi:ribonuclease HII
MSHGNQQGWPDLALESELWQAGFSLVAGLDEAGRGCWAGPVVAAAVMLPAQPALCRALHGRVDDSKRLSPAERARLVPMIHECAVAVGCGSVPANEIDRIGIVAATRLAMVQALAALAVYPDYMLLDYLTLPGLPLPQRGVPHGDRISLSIAAASIIAKVTRDRWMVAQEQHYSGYGFARHKGYGTAEHRLALQKLGVCPIHRLSFQPLAALYSQRPAGLECETTQE